MKIRPQRVILELEEFRNNLDECHNWSATQEKCLYNTHNPKNLEIQKDIYKTYIYIRQTDRQASFYYVLLPLFNVHR